ncbi:hypothetical protein [Ponticaulis sp.]|uniref:hypothetical protein n=1 Tax=Ponticaulis sp. TaxID=2020902 RepID=UPI0026371180|nr:hypothetical protein [Ponticaulis sp.]MDF1680659.1 hypothetical protein [Ponticaulis sp.]
MNPAPSSAPDYTSLTIGQLIGLNLARLYAWCMRLHASGETYAPRDLARMVISTDAMVHAYVRMLASSQLERAGFKFAANAMRTPVWQRAGSLVCSRAPSARIERAQGCLICSRETDTHIELVQGCELISLAELFDRLQTTIENFERAETLASHLARVIVCALAYIAPEVRTRCTYQVAVNEPDDANSNPVVIAKEPWPPPFRKPERQYAFKNP